MKNDNVPLSIIEKQKTITLHSNTTSVFLPLIPLPSFTIHPFIRSLKNNLTVFIKNTTFIFKQNISQPPSTSFILIVAQ